MGTLHSLRDFFEPGVQKKKKKKKERERERNRRVRIETAAERDQGRP